MLPLKAMRLLRRLEAHNIDQTTRNLVEGKKLNKSKSVFLYAEPDLDPDPTKNAKKVKKIKNERTTFCEIRCF
jgi:hypothetical protein